MDLDRPRGHHSRQGTANTDGSASPSEAINADEQQQEHQPRQRMSAPTSVAKRPKRNPSVKCPICHEVVAPSQYQQHYRTELALLDAATSNEGSRGKRGAAIAATKQFTKGKGRATGADADRQNVIRDIQKRRTARQNHTDVGTVVGGGSSRHLLGPGLGLLADTQEDDAPATCFICNERLFGSLDDINAHIDSCLTNPRPAHHPSGTNSGYNSSAPTTPNSGGVTNSVASTPNSHRRPVDDFEEYTWAGQTRVRATSLFEGGMGALGSGSGSRSGQMDVEDDLNVDDDEEDEYGGAQFSERDVVVNEEDQQGDGDELRESVLASSVAVQRAPPSPSGSDAEERMAGSGRRGHKKQKRMDRHVDIEDEGADDLDPSSEEDEEEEEDEEIDLEGDYDDQTPEEIAAEREAMEQDRVNSLLNSAFALGDTRLVIEALRSKIKHLESANRNAPSCLICLDPYTVPLTSIVCWHVHCEACWMKTLGSKKLCPQCQKITLPKDLRRIYL